MNRDNMERGEFITHLETTIEQAANRMEMHSNESSLEQFSNAADVWQRAQELWLQVAQHMNPRKAHAVMVGFAMAGNLARWKDERQLGPPPTVLSLYKERHT